MIDRRTVLAATPLLAVWPALAQQGPPELVAYEHRTGGRIGLFAANLKTGKSFGHRADERFVMCSTFKASLAACVLSRVDAGKERLDRMVPYGAKDLQPYAPVARDRANLARGAMTIETMCRAAVELSDNTCANVLLTTIGGPAGLTRFWRATGDMTSRLDHNEPELNRSRPGDPHDTTTPVAIAGTLRHVLVEDVLSPASRGRLIGWMIGCQTGAMRLRAGLPKTWRIGDKTGNNGADAAGDLLIAWPGSSEEPILGACFVQGGRPAPGDIDRVFAAAGRLVAERLV